MFAIKLRSVLLVCLPVLFDTASAAETALPVGPELMQWLEQGAYLSWPRESDLHLSAGPHFGKVLIYINPVLFESLQIANVSHPKGAGAVKELYRQDDSSSSALSELLKPEQPAPLAGWAVSIKLDADSAGGSNWYWFETVNNYSIADGQGLPGCMDCHRDGKDFILSPGPFQ